MTNAQTRPLFWQTYHLHELTHAEWEALCDGCGTCCLVKFLEEDESSEEVIYTDVACQLLDCTTGWCADYASRHDYVPDCINLRHEQLEDMMWLPNSCAYKRLYCGLDLPDWHYLLTNNKEKTAQGMREAGIGVAGRCRSEVGMTDEEIEERAVQWVLV